MKTFLNLTKSEWKEFGKDVLIRLAIGLPAVFLVAALGSAVHASWLVIPVTPIITGTVGYLIAKKDDKKTLRNVVIGYAALGLIFGLIGFITN